MAGSIVSPKRVLMTGWISWKNKNMDDSAGKMRINIASFEKWYANQIKYHKVTGEDYDLINKNNMEVVVADYWKRIPKDSFQKWYDSQSRYRTKEEREKDAIC